MGLPVTHVVFRLCIFHFVLLSPLKFIAVGLKLLFITDQTLQRPQPGSLCGRKPVIAVQLCGDRFSPTKRVSLRLGQCDRDRFN